MIMKSLLVATAPVPALIPAALYAAISDLDHPVVTSAQLRVSGGAGSRYGAAGVADLWQRPDDRFRIGSITEVFVATVVLQPAAEHAAVPTTSSPPC